MPVSGETEMNEASLLTSRSIYVSRERSVTQLWKNQMIKAFYKEPYTKITSSSDV